MSYFYFISVVIPTFNRRDYLARAIESVMSQSFSAMECIVVDDGSTDGTAQWLHDTYPEVICVTQSQQGVSAARNHGIRLAKGDWIAFLDSDDAWYPDKLASQVNALSASPSSMLCHTNEHWYRHGKRVNPMKKHTKLGGSIFQACLDLCLISPSSVLINKDFLRNIGGFNEQMPACEDYDLWLRITAQHSVLYLEQPLTIKYGGHADQLSQAHWGMDRFRIQSLIRVIKSGQLNASDKAAACRVLRRKTTIFLNGAIKRNKHRDVTYYESILQQYPE